MRRYGFYGFALTALMLTGMLTGTLPGAFAQTPPLSFPVDPARIHPAFRVTPEQAAERIREGRTFAQKKSSEKEVLAKHTRATRAVRGPADAAGGEAQCLGIHGNLLTLESFRAAARPEKAPPPEEFGDGGFTRALQFCFFLLSNAEPVKDAKANGRAPSEDNLRETMVTRVILSDDQGNHTEAFPKVRRDAEAT